jgi:hypothetical protein
MPFGAWTAIRRYYEVNADLSSVLDLSYFVGTVGRLMPVHEGPGSGLSQPSMVTLAALGGSLSEADTSKSVAMGSYRAISNEIAITLSIAITLALDEAKSLPGAANLSHVVASLPRRIDDIVLVDEQSADGTVAVARRPRPEVRVVMQAGRGKEYALLAGSAACQTAARMGVASAARAELT